jgi:hypothetical protein
MLWVGGVRRDELDDLGELGGGEDSRGDCKELFALTLRTFRPAFIPSGKIAVVVQCGVHFFFRALIGLTG